MSCRTINPLRTIDGRMLVTERHPIFRVTYLVQNDGQNAESGDTKVQVVK